MNPETWGPKFWLSLHSVTFDYPLKPDESEKIRSNEILQQSFEYELAGLTSYNNAKNSNP